MKQSPIRTAVFPVAGLGTRFLPATKASPKEMLVVVDKPLIQYAVEEARDSGIENFIFVTSHGKSAIEDHFDVNYSLEQMLESRGKLAELAILREYQLDPGQAVFIRQQVPLGLGHAVWCARHLVGDHPFALILADDLILSKKPCLSQMIEAYGHLNGNVVAVMDVPPEQVNRYGILDVVKEDSTHVQARGVIEKPDIGSAPSNTAIVGRYILQPEIFTILENVQKGAGGEIQLTDAFPTLIERMPFHGLRFEGTRFDCGLKEGWLEANLAFAYARSDLKDSLLTSIRKHCN
ncbi:MAG: UTP--glucose-1-phosphate uridylyltransferase GalU [Alphaproteobacteria bacterium]|jgi:UTP--glucose-1-phosphate uridylyltransferase|nr:UTP--glucose-1-phosphate uridylyltransferase GalU [Alphaproteobacteria bacterium]